jgi:hypothetical protein
VRRSDHPHSIEDGSHGAERSDRDRDRDDASRDEGEVRASFAASVRRAACREPEGALPAALLERQLRSVWRHVSERLLRRRLIALQPYGT